MFTNESEAYHSASVVPIHTRSELFSDSNSDSDSAYDSASVASVASVNQPLAPMFFDFFVGRMFEDLSNICPTKDMELTNMGAKRSSIVGSTNVV